MIATLEAARQDPNIWGPRGLRDWSEFDRLISEADHNLTRLEQVSQNPDFVYRRNKLGDLLHEAGQGSGRARRVASFYLQEAMSTSDFPLLMGDILDRQLLAKYQVAQPSWRAYCKADTVNDFRQKRLIATDGARGRYTPTYKRPELTEVQESDDFNETGYLYSVDVFEKSIALDWRLLVNDDLGAFNGLPDDLNVGALRTEQYMATALYATSGGPDSTFFSDTHKNKIDTTNGASATNPPLSTSALMDAFTIFAKQVDSNGEPIEVMGAVLVVPPGLKPTANNIIQATQLWVNDRGGTTDERLIVANWVASDITVVVNPYLPIIDSSHGGTAWYVFADPNANRPAISLGFLRGYETPSLFMKAPNTVRVGGGAVDPMLGDFDTHELRYKGMHILGSVQLDPKMAVASNGSGS